jgi:isopenicillin-N epimerase
VYTYYLTNYFDEPQLKHLWNLDPALTFLNHGSFGAPPARVLELQAAIRSEMEHRPDFYFVFGALDRLYAAREPLAHFLSADSADLVWVRNATAGVNTVLRSLQFERGDEILTTNHVYNSCGNVLDYLAVSRGVRIVTAKIPFPVKSATEVTGAIVGAVTNRTRLALIDHITSSTALIFPIAQIVAELQRRGVDCLVDGAHAPGQVMLNLENLGAAYYTGNCHKWLCAPRASAFLHVRRDRQDLIHPLVISHGSNAPELDYSQFQRRFQWMGTEDLTGFLCVPESLAYLAAQVSGGWPSIMKRNHELLMQVSRQFISRLDCETPAPEEMTGSMIALPLPEARAAKLEKALQIVPEREARTFAGDSAVTVRNPSASRFCYYMHRELGIDAVGYRVAANGRFVVRLSCHLYNVEADYDRLLVAVERLTGGK